MAALDTDQLETKVQELYRQVAEDPRGGFHFEVGRELAERLGYDTSTLAGVPAEAIESFAGVGYFFDLAQLRPGERVVDLGSGSGMDSFYAALLVGRFGRVVGVDYTPAQLAKARRLATVAALSQVEFRQGRVERLPVNDASFDCVISNGVINLTPAKKQVFAEAARVLVSGGRLAVADIVSEKQLTDAIVADADLWASCIGGAAQEDDYRDAIEAAGLRIEHVRENSYQFLSERARDASVTYGVKSISILAVKPRS